MPQAPDFTMHAIFNSTVEPEKTYKIIFLSIIDKNDVFTDSIGKIFFFSNPNRPVAYCIKCQSKIKLGSFSNGVFTPILNWKKYNWRLVENSSDTSCPWELQILDELDESLNDFVNFKAGKRKSTPFEKRTKNELIALAKSRRLKVTPSMKKENIIEMLRK